MEWNSWVKKTTEVSAPVKTFFQKITPGSESAAADWKLSAMRILRFQRQVAIGSD